MSKYTLRQEGKVIKYRKNKDSIDLVINISNSDDLIKNIGKIKECEVIFKDKRAISKEQRKKIYALLKEISIWQGDDVFSVKQNMKIEYAMISGEEISLSDCSMKQAEEFIEMLINFIIENNVPVKEVNNLVKGKDTNGYLWNCIKEHKCCISGKKGKIYVIDEFEGKGKTKAEFTKICLSDKYYEEAKKIGREKFFEKYGVYGVKV